jgi:hypothetical protein
MSLMSSTIELHSPEEMIILTVLSLLILAYLVRALDS